jgi:hypothetical protein
MSTRRGLFDGQRGNRILPAERRRSNDPPSPLFIEPAKRCWLFLGFGENLKGILKEGVFLGLAQPAKQSLDCIIAHPPNL